MEKKFVENLVGECLEKYPTLFLIDLKLDSGNNIKLTLDGDQSVSIDDCVKISREIEHSLNEIDEDFSLKVISAGITAPLQFPRQFRKNIGRKLKLKARDKKFKATLVAVDDEGIELEWKAREPKPVGKGKHTVKKNVKLNYKEIKEAKVLITFN